MSGMSIVYNKLKTGGIAEDIFFEVSESGANKPYIVLLNDGIDPANTKSSGSKLDRVQIRVLCLGDRYFTTGAVKGASSLADQVRDVLDFTQTGEYEIYFQSEMSDSLKTNNNRAYIVEQTYYVFEYRTLTAQVGATNLEADLEADLNG